MVSFIKARAGWLVVAGIHTFTGVFETSPTSEAYSDIKKICTRQITASHLPVHAVTSEEVSVVKPAGSGVKICFKH